MKSTIKVICTVLMALLVFSVSAYTASAQTINSAEALKEYLEKQPVNSLDKPIKVTISANDLMMGKIVEVINSAGKYVSLDLSGNTLTTIPNNAFFDVNKRIGCAVLVGITIPNNVTSIWNYAFGFCTGLKSVKFEGTIASENFATYAFEPLGDLRAKYFASGGGPGTYTRPSGNSNTWTKR